MSEALDPKTLRTAAHAMSRIFVAPGTYTTKQLHDEMSGTQLSGTPKTFDDALGVLRDREWIEAGDGEQPPTLNPSRVFVERAVEIRMYVATLGIGVQQKYDQAVIDYRELMASPEGQRQLDARIQFLGTVAMLSDMGDLNDSGKVWFPDAIGWEVLTIVEAELEANPDKYLLYA